MTDNMVERVARAAYESEAGAPLRHPNKPDEFLPVYSWEELPSKPVWRSIARAAIAAMRDSTEEMEDAPDRRDRPEIEITSEMEDALLGALGKLYLEDGTYDLSHAGRVAICRAILPIKYTWQAMIDTALAGKL